LAFVLQAQSSLASAEQNYYTSLSSYAQAIMDLNYRKGTLLDYHNVTLSESDWTPAAYRDAVRDAWARAHAIPANFLRSEPSEIQLPYDIPGAGAPAAGAAGSPVGPPSPTTPPAGPSGPPAGPAMPPAAPPTTPTPEPQPGKPVAAGPDLGPGPPGH
jgi:hypothetical protein